RHGADRADRFRVVQGTTDNAQDRKHCAHRRGRIRPERRRARRLKSRRPFPFRNAAAQETSMRLIPRGLVLIAPLALLAACATAPVGPPVAPPRFAVGDHWQYRVTDNMRRGAVSQIDAEVVALTGDVATLRVVKLDGGTRSEWTDEIEGGGGLRAGMLDDSTRRFAPAAALLAFPLEQGKTWRQVLPCSSGNASSAAAGAKRRVESSSIPARRPPPPS